MIYIFMALYAEAKPLIRRLGLKREQTELSFDVYGNPETEIRLVITGVGSIAAATAVGSSLTCFQAGREDFVVNIGSCAGKGTPGTGYLCHRITDRVSGHTFYPDMLYRHPFGEASVVTEPEILKNGACDGLHDMEAAAVYQAGAYFLGPHQMSFIKVVSDDGAGSSLSAEQLERVTEQQLEPIVEYLETLEGLVRFQRQESPRGQMDGEGLKRLCAELHCSQTMRAAVEQCIRYCTLSGIEYQDLLREMRRRGELPCRDRREGKKKFEELKGRLL